MPTEPITAAPEVFVPPPSRPEAAAYIADMLCELRDLARDARLAMLAYLIDMARVEATEIAERQS